MNPRKVAVLYRRLAELDVERAEVLREIATVLEDGAPANDAPVRKARAKPRPGPVNVPTDLDREKARQALRRAGLVGLRR